MVRYIFFISCIVRPSFSQSDLTTSYKVHLRCCLRAMHEDRRCILVHCGVQEVRLIPSDLRALHLELFTVPSDF